LTITTHQTAQSTGQSCRRPLRLPPPLPSTGGSAVSARGNCAPPTSRQQTHAAVRRRSYLSDTSPRKCRGSARTSSVPVSRIRTGQVDHRDGYSGKPPNKGNSSPSSAPPPRPAPRPASAHTKPRAWLEPALRKQHAGKAEDAARVRDARRDDR